MISLFSACCSSILSKSAHFVPRSPSRGYFSSWNTSLKYPAIRTIKAGALVSKIRVQCYSSKKSSGGSSRKKKIDPVASMKDDKEAFFVVRKGDLVGIYKSLSDCQAQVGTSICDPPVSVFKGYSMPKDTEKYLLSCGLKNALYSIRAADLTNDLFGTLVACPVVMENACPMPITPTLSRGETSKEPISKKRDAEAMWTHYGQSCTLEFDGASKGNPGQAGAGAILRSDDGSLICRLREGLGVATNNVAEYRAFILGLRAALEKGFTSVQVRGDSKLVCMQIQGLWRVKNQNISIYYEEAKKLKDRFTSFQIKHILRDLNSEADAQANLAVGLADGQVMEDIDKQEDADGANSKKLGSCLI